MMIIAFVSYPVANLDRAVEFYQKVLGIEPLFHREGWAEFKLEGQRFALKKKTPLQKREDTGATVYFMAKPIQNFIDRLEGFGAKILGSVETHSYGKLARFKDPEGNIFGLYEPPFQSITVAPVTSVEVQSFYMNNPLTHFNEEGRARMVDVSDKSITSRKAVATGEIYLQPETLRLINEGQIKKGDVLAVAQVAGIMGAKKSHEIIPMCHPLLLTGIDINFEKNNEPDPKTGLCSITITGTVKVTGQTGVEMEALTAVSTAALTIYDMCKAVDRGMYFDKIGLVHKSGGKSGTYEKESVGQ